MIDVVIDEVEMADWWRGFGSDEANGEGIGR
jgi:phenylpyruvate tautomerase PptA (4-oxalocrotonate tautomerase family)